MSEIKDLSELGSEFKEINRLFFEIMAEARHTLQKSQFQKLETILKELKMFHEQELECLERIRIIQQK